VAKTLLVMRGAEPLTKATTPERNWLSQELLRNTLPSMIGDAMLPPMAVAYPNLDDAPTFRWSHPAGLFGMA
jgi:hypothetical protein